MARRQWCLHRMLTNHHQLSAVYWLTGVWGVDHLGLHRACLNDKLYGLVEEGQVESIDYLYYYCSLNSSLVFIRFSNLHLSKKCTVACTNQYNFFHYQFIFSFQADDFRGWTKIWKFWQISTTALTPRPTATFIP